MKGSPNEVVYDAGQREVILGQMTVTCNRYYQEAVASHCHPWIEFCGLQSEYIQLCRRAHAQGLDFTQANTHSGIALPMQDYNAQYIAEKLNCIYGPALLNSKPLADAFIATLFEGKYKLVPAKET